jgi:hypothetical protein
MRPSAPCVCVLQPNRYVRLEMRWEGDAATKWVAIRCVGDAAEAESGTDEWESMQALMAPHDLAMDATADQLADAATALELVAKATKEAGIEDAWVAKWDARRMEAFEEGLKEEARQLRAGKKKQVKGSKHRGQDRPNEEAAGTESPDPAAAVAEGVPPVAGVEDAEQEEDEEEEEEEDSEDEDYDDDSDFDDSDEEDYERQRALPPLGREAQGVRLVVDEGYGSTRFGVAGEAEPTVLSNTREEDNGACGGRPPPLFRACLGWSGLMQHVWSAEFRYIIERQKLDAMAVDWEALEAQWYHMFETELDVEGDCCSVLCTISPFASKDYAETLGELLFETFDNTGIYFTNSSILSLYAQGKTTGLVVDSGECTTSAFPVYEGVINKHAVKTIPFGGRDITDYIKRQLKKEYPSIDMADYATNELMRQIKHECCYCGEPRPAPDKTCALRADGLGHSTPSLIQVDAIAPRYTLPDGQTITLDEDSDFPYRAPVRATC